MDICVVSCAFHIENLLRRSIKDRIVLSAKSQLFRRYGTECHLGVAIQKMDGIDIVPVIVINGIGNMADSDAGAILFDLPGKVDALKDTIRAVVRPEGIHYKAQKNLSTVGANMQRCRSQIVDFEAQWVIFLFKGFHKSFFRTYDLFSGGTKPQNILMAMIQKGLDVIVIVAHQQADGEICNGVYVHSEYLS